MKISLLLLAIIPSVLFAQSRLENNEDVENAVNVDGTQWSYQLEFKGSNLSTETGKDYKLTLYKKGKPKFWGDVEIRYFDILTRINFPFIYKDGKDKGNKLDEKLVFKYMAEQSRIQNDQLKFRTGAMNLDEAVFESIEQLIKLL